jgi:Na+/melibiose symporter-like transporter
VRISIACYEIPSNALIPELSPDYTERTTLIAFRWLFGAIGAGLTITLALSLFMTPTKEQPTGILNPHGYFAYSIMTACLMFGSVLLSAAGTHNRIRYLQPAPARTRYSLSELAREAFHSISNGSFLAITFSAIFGGIAFGLVLTLGTYINTYFWKFTAQQLAALGLGAALATVIAVVTAPIISAAMDKRRGYFICAIASLILNNITITLKLFGLLPVGNPNTLLLIIFASTLVGLTFGLSSLILVSSMIADVAEDSELKTGRRSEGLFSASISFVQKSTSGFGILLSGLLLDFVAFPKHASPLTIDPQIMRHLLFIYMPTQLGLFAISSLCLLGYRIDRATHEANLARLAQSPTAAESIHNNAKSTGAAEEQSVTLRTSPSTT